VTPPLDQLAPDFELVDQHGTPVRLSQLRGNPVLIVFYPWSFSRICGGELAALRDSDLLNQLRILAISTDSMFAQRVYSDAEGFPFSLLADFWPHGAVARLYGVFDETAGVAVRGSFLIDAAGILRWSVVKGIGESRDLESYQQALEALPR
jgi:peroxiredoxin